MEELRLRVDSAFLPRPLLLVDRLPRNAAGKLPLAAVEEMLAQRGGRRGRAMSTELRFAIAPDHPAFAGHFPGSPLLPGALLLDEIVRRLPRPPFSLNGTLRLTRVKFRRPVLPGTSLQLRYEWLAGGVAFRVEDGQGVVADGVARADD
jgi:3-hydroxymyristoyl/3-hydroxydecanoyl-(acyl carrier protein) dehydratase